MEFSTLVQFSKIVSDSSSSEVVFPLLVRTVVERCNAIHAYIFVTSEEGYFQLLSSYGSFEAHTFDLAGVGSVAEVTALVMEEHGGQGYGVGAFPLISEAGLFGTLIILYSEKQPPAEREWKLIEGLTELSAISLNKAHQHRKLQKAYDNLRLSQETLIRSEKLRALGQMSAGIAHDLKNILNPLMLYNDIIRDEAGNRAEVEDLSGKIDKILVRGLETVERLREFSRQSPDDSESVPVDLNDIAREAAEICRPRLGKVKLEIELGNPAAVLIRPSDAVTSIVNLLFNAIEALQGTGTIVISTGESNHRAWIQVQDNGPGMPPEVRAHILEPFFTTKGSSGTGLGVSTVYAFALRHGGDLEIESEPGHGARFRLWFPIAVDDSSRQG